MNDYDSETVNFKLLFGGKIIRKIFAEAFLGGLYYAHWFPIQIYEHLIITNPAQFGITSSFTQVIQHLSSYFNKISSSGPDA